VERRAQLRADRQRIAQVLAGLHYPAARWQVLAEADHYGADAGSRAQLHALPPAIYRDLGDVLVRLGLLSARVLPEVRPRSMPPQRGPR
jgi:hypothetical protein